MPGLLIVEDDISVRDMICDIFDSSEYRKYVAGDGIEALHLLATGIVIDTILCDINMPNMDGIELLQKIRVKGIEAPIIFLTGEDNPSLLIKALQGGAFDFLYKTGNLDKL